MSPFISVVMPVYNEARYIDICMESLLRQDYPRDRMEWIFVDGCSQDDTVAKLDGYAKQYPGLISVCSNPDKTVPYAMNIGIRASKGVYIIRLDAHAEYAEDYFSACERVLEKTGADNVGGIMETKSLSEMGHTIAAMVSSPFGVGGARFRTGGEDGYVDTVPFGAFRREIFDKIGLYDERLTRNQDSELNYRILHNGGKIYISHEIRLAYYCRDTVKGILKMGNTNGKWNVITNKLCPGSMRLRHFVPLGFVLSLVLLPLLGLAWHPIRGLFGLEIAAYLICDAVFSAKCGLGPKETLRLMGLFPAFHVCYGVGSLQGLWQTYVLRKF